jgi:dihydroorotate dehydrogenase (fumarate)/dihydroorotate dehydrogenase
MLFRISPDKAHHLAAIALRRRLAGQILGGKRIHYPNLEVINGPIRLPGPIGLAPGFDKFGEFTAGASRLGFDYLVPGTIMAEKTSEPTRGSIARIPDQRALINCQGRPSKGAPYSAASLQRGKSAVPLIASIGSQDIPGFLACHATIEPQVAAVELNLQCHNEGPGLFADPGALTELLNELMGRKNKPLFVRINAYSTQDERQARLALVERALSSGVEGFSAVGTAVRQADSRLYQGRGVVTGAPIREFTLSAIRDLWAATGGQAIIRARGGIFSGKDAFDAIAAGATTVEVFTAFVYRGWSVARKIRQELHELLIQNSIPTVNDLRGSEYRGR